MQSESKLAIVIVVYNIPSLITKQIECIRKYCKDEHDIIVIDNSDIKEVYEAVEYYCQQANVRRIKTFSADKEGSNSHVFACNLSYQKLKDEYDMFFYLDHDNFPIKEFSVRGILEDKSMAGLGQGKSTIYYWAGCVMWDDKKTGKDIIDFSVNHELRLDTGGNLYKAIERCSIDNCKFFSEVYHENPHFKNSFYNFYAVIGDTFMHFINASGWNPTEGNIERINSLINILTEKTK